MYKNKKAPATRAASWTDLSKTGDNRSIAGTSHSSSKKKGPNDSHKKSSAKKTNGSDSRSVSKSTTMKKKKYVATTIKLNGMGVARAGGGVHNRRRAAPPSPDMPPKKKQSPSPKDELKETSKVVSATTTTTSTALIKAPSSPTIKPPPGFEIAIDGKPSLSSMKSTPPPLSFGVERSKPDFVFVLYNSAQQTSESSSRLTFGGIQFSAEAMSELRNRGCDPGGPFARVDLTAVQLFDEKGAIWMSDTAAGCLLAKAVVPAKYSEYVVINENAKGLETVHVDFSKACFDRLTEMLEGQSATTPTPTVTLDDIRAMKEEIDADMRSFETCKAIHAHCGDLH